MAGKNNPVKNNGLKPSEHFIPLRGNACYLPVAWRIAWFRDDHPEWTLETENLRYDESSAVFKATVRNEDGRIIATGYGSETKGDFKDFYEKAETKSLGRALQAAGYGSAAADAESEGSLIVDDEADMVCDSPVQGKRPASPSSADKPRLLCACSECGTLIEDVTITDPAGRQKKIPAQKILENSRKKYGRELCADCSRKAAETVKGEPAPSDPPAPAPSAAAGTLAADAPEPRKADTADEKTLALQSTIPFGPTAGKTISEAIAAGQKSLINYYATNPDFFKVHPDIAGTCRCALGMAG